MIHETTEVTQVLLRAKEGFVVPAMRVTIKSGQIVSSDDPVVKGREHLFEPVETGIERATQAPGEQRITGRHPDRDQAVVARGEKDTRRRGPAKKTTG